MKNSKLVLTLIAIAMTMAVFGGCLALYVMNADELKVTIGFGEIVELQMTADGASDSAVLDPENSSKTYTVTLTTYDETLKDSTRGKFYVQITSDNALSEKVIFTVTENGASGRTYTHDEICTLTEEQPDGACYYLNELPTNLSLSYRLSDDVVNDFYTYADQEVTFTLNWVICEDAVPTTRRIYVECDTMVLQGSITKDNGSTAAITFLKEADSGVFYYDVSFEKFYITIIDKTNGVPLVDNMEISEGTKDIKIDDFENESYTEIE